MRDLVNKLVGAVDMHLTINDIIGKNLGGRDGRLISFCGISVMEVEILSAVMGCSSRSATLAMESLAWGGADTGQ